MIRTSPPLENEVKQKINILHYYNHIYQSSNETYSQECNRGSSFTLISLCMSDISSSCTFQLQILWQFHRHLMYRRFLHYPKDTISIYHVLLMHPSVKCGKLKSTFRNLRCINVSENADVKLSAGKSKHEDIKQETFESCYQVT